MIIMVLVAVWFFLGLFFHFITALVLLGKNAADERSKREGLEIS